MNQWRFTPPSHFGLRIFWVIIGNLMMGLSLSVLMKLNLGTDSYSCFASGFSKLLHMSYGNGQLIAQLIMIVAVLLYGREMIGIGTIVNMVFIGYIADFGTFVLDSFIPKQAWSVPIVRFGSLIPAMPVFVLGAALYMAVNLGMSPFDALPFVISKWLPKVSFRTIRMIWDLSFMIMGFVLGGTAGLITFLGVLFLGPVISFLRGKMEKLL